MKYRLTLILGAVLALSTFTTEASAASRHLICRGKAGTEIRLSSSLALPGKIALEWGFDKYTGSKSNIKSNGGHLSPGQCSWDTAVITESYLQYIFYRAEPSAVWFSVGVTSDMSTPGENWGSLGYFTSTKDKNVMWLPCFCSKNPSKGSIYDPAMVFHFYVNIIEDLELELYKTTWNSFPYPGR
jgi:hypothetical protein